MERLTKRDTDGQAMMDCEKCKADWTGKHGKPMADCTALYCRNRLLDRLAEYEDTEEQLRRLCRDCDLDRLEELVKADKAGRLVVRPVKPVLTPILSSMLYIIEDGYIYEDALYEAFVGMSGNGEMNVAYTTLFDLITFEQADIGKTVFLTREEAKKALEAMKNE